LVLQGFRGCRGDQEGNLRSGVRGRKSRHTKISVGTAARNVGQPQMPPSKISIF